MRENAEQYQNRNIVKIRYVVEDDARVTFSIATTQR